jgi:Pentapeptide repeats (9 copies)
MRKNINRSYYIGIILAVIMLILILWLIPKWQIRGSGIDNAEKRFIAENESRKTLAQILGGAVLLLSVYLAWQTLQARWIDVELSKEGQITERFTRAIDQLGSDKLEIKLGGIYALERIAKDSPKDHWPIMEMLTAYVRENAPWPSKEEDRTGDLFERKVLDFTEPSIEEVINKPKSDIQAIMTVLQRRDWANEREIRDRIDLRNTNLLSVDLHDANLQGAILMDTNLENAWLYKTNLEGAFLIRSNLKNAYLDKANLSYSTLTESDLEGAKLKDVNLEGAELKYAVLYGVDLTNAIGLTRDQVDSAITDNKTKLPASL